MPSDPMTTLTPEALVKLLAEDTPGPWEIRPNSWGDIRTVDGGVRAAAIAQCISSNGDYETAKANAALVSIAPTLATALLSSQARERELVEAARLALGDHNAPHDCYATGPRTGDPIMDYVFCPGCALDTLLTRIEADRKGEQL